METSETADKYLPVRATRTWLGPQGPHAPSNLGKGGIINNNEAARKRNLATLRAVHFRPGPSCPMR